MRHYQGKSELAAELKKHGKDVEKAMTAVHGFLAYDLMEGAEGVTAVTICETGKGCEESNRIAAEWLHKNLPNLKIPAPRVATGQVALAFDRSHSFA